MMRILMVCFMALGLPVSLQAQDPTQYCNDMYSSDAYDGEDRYRLLQECIASQADTSANTETPPEPDYYDGTVEDYVNQVPEENTATQ
jgi:hypothetical protein